MEELTSCSSLSRRNALNWPVECYPKRRTATRVAWLTPLFMAVATLAAAQPSVVLDAPYLGVTLHDRAGAMVLADLNDDGILDLVVPNINLNSVAVALGRGDGSFFGNTNYQVGSLPNGAAVADFDDDGLLDVAVVNYGSASVSVLIGHGDGTLAPAVDNPVDAGPVSIAAGDFDGDGRAEIAIGITSSDRIQILRGGTGGVFTPWLILPNVVGPYALTTGDLQGDGHDDLVAVSSGASAFSVFVGGPGGFVTRGVYTTSGIPGSVALGKLNADSMLDVAVSSRSATGGSIAIWVGIGAGQLGPGANIPLSANPLSVAIGDVGGTFGGDILVATEGSTSLSVLLDPGFGLPQPAVELLPGFGTRFVAAGHLNGDGYADVVISSDLFQTVLALNSKGDGSFGVARETPTGTAPAALAVAELDGDGRPDLVTLQHDGVSVWAGDGTGRFGMRTDYSAGPIASALLLEDLDGDSRPDMVVANEGGGTVSVRMGEMGGSFGPRVDYMSGPSPAALAIIDLDHDGDPDLVIANNELPPAISTLLGAGGGTFGSPNEFSVGVRGRSVIVGSFDLDDHPDVAIIGGADTLIVLPGLGDGTFGPETFYLTALYPTGLATADVSADGRADLIVACAASNQISVLLGDPDGRFGPRSDYAAPVSLGSAALVVEDMNRDGAPDLIAAGGGGATISVLAGYGDGTFGPRVEFGAGKHPTSVAIGDVYPDSWPDIVAGNIGARSVFSLVGAAMLVAVEPPLPRSGVQVAPSYPNPTSGPVVFRFWLDSEAFASLTIYDAAGRRVRTVFTGVAQPGMNSVRWDGVGRGGSLSPSGVYFHVLRTGQERITRRMAIVR